MFRGLSRALLHVGGRRAQGPTVTIKVASNTANAPVQTTVRKERIVRPLTEEEENYELLRAKRVGSGSLRVKGKQSIQISRKSADRRHASYDQI